MNVRQLKEQMNRPVPQSNISRHLKVLLDAGVVSCTERGTSHFYTVKETAIQQALAQLQEYTGLPQ
jgi:DNA-binding transcriptional ArsR family regulator